MKRLNISLYILILSICSFLQSTAQVTSADSLIKLLENKMSDTTRMNILFEIVEKSENDTVWPSYNEKAYQIAKQLLLSKDSILHFKGMRGMGDALNNKAYFEDHNGNTEAAIQYNQKSIFYRQDSDDKRGLGESYNNIASVYYSQGNILKAIEYNQKSLKIREELGDKKAIAQSLNNLGYIYKDQGEPEKALEYFLRSVELKKSIGDKKGIANTYNNIGLIYLQEGKNDTALDYFNKSLAIRESIGHKWGIANSLNNIGLLHLNKNELVEARECAERSLKIREEIKDYEGISYSLRYLSEINLKQNKLDKALDLAIRSMKIATNAGYAENIRFTSKILYKIYKQKGDFENALKMFELNKHMEDSLNNAETKKGAIKSQLKYEFEKQEGQLKADQLVKEKLNQKESEKQKLIRNVLILGFAIMVIFSVILFRSFKNKQKANTIIAMQKAMVEEKQKEILDSIHYAKKIQQSLLPTEKYIDKNLNRLKK